MAQLDRRIMSSNARLQTPGIIDPLETERQEKADLIGKEIESMLEEVWRTRMSLVLLRTSCVVDQCGKGRRMVRFYESEGRAGERGGEGVKGSHKIHSLSTTREGVL